MIETQTFRDRLALGANPERLRMSAFRALDRTQDDPAVQIRGLALALAGICNATGLDMRELIVSSENMINDLDGPYSTQMKAIREYALNEIGRFK